MNHPKKILIYYSIFHLGGAERSTNKLITKLLDKGHQVEFLLVTKGGNYEKEIDPRAKVSHLRSGDYGTKFFKTKGLLKLLYLLLYSFTLVESKLKALLFKFKRYDAVIIGLHGLNPEFCLKYIKAEVYLQFLRNDLSKCDDEGKAKKNIEKYGTQINYYIAVSQTAKDSFVNQFPELSHKVKKIYNLIEAEIIAEKAKREIREEDATLFSDGDFIILSVCRIQDKSKALFRMADVFKKISSESSIKMKWLIIGEGVDFDELQKYIASLELQEKMLLLGHRNNPYPYFLRANLVAVLSYYEGLCGVVNEAKVLQRPLLATEFSGIHEQIEHKFNGYIVENDHDSIYEGLNYLLYHRELLERLSVNKMPQSITNDMYKIEQLESLLFNNNE